MRLLLVGPPGSGKGTQAKRIADHFVVAHIASGDLLRLHVARGTDIGRLIEEYLSRGDLVPDDVVMEVMRGSVVAAARAGGYVLDGFPRTVHQAEAPYLAVPDLNTSVQAALYLDVPRDELIRRALARGAVAGRTDDRLDVITHRLDVFERATRPLLDYYAAREMLLTVDGARPVTDVTRSTIERLELIRPQLR